MEHLTEVWGCLGEPTQFVLFFIGMILAILGALYLIFATGTALAWAARKITDKTHYDESWRMGAGCLFWLTCGLAYPLYDLISCLWCPGC